MTIAPLSVLFDGDSAKLAHFLAHMWHQVECYGEIYPDNAVWIHIVVSNLEGVMAGWLMYLHDAFMKIL